MSDAANPWTTAHQDSLLFTVSWSLLKLMSIESMMPSNHLTLLLFPFLSCLQSFPASGSFPMSRLFASGGQSFGAWATATVIPVNIQGRFLLRLRVWFPCSLEDSEESSPAPYWKVSILWHLAVFMVQLSHLHMTTGKTVTFTIQTFFSKVMSLLFNMLSRFVIPFLPRNKRLLISLLQSLSTVILEYKENKICHCFHVFPIYLSWSDWTRCHDLSFLNVEC